MTFKATLLSKFPPANFTFKGLDFLVDVIDVSLQAAALAESFIAGFAPILLEGFMDVVLVSVQRKDRPEADSTRSAGVRSLPRMYQSVLVGCHFRGLNSSTYVTLVLLSLRMHSLHVLTQMKLGFEQFTTPRALNTQVNVREKVISDLAFVSERPLAQVTLKPLVVVGYLVSQKLVVRVEHVAAHLTRERDVEAQISVYLFMSA